MASVITPYRGTPASPYNPSTQEYYPVEYFSGVDLSIFFQDQYIDEICELEYVLMEKKFPVYGYASYTANKIVTGVRIIQGSFTVNMRPGDYMHELLNTISKQNANPSVSVSNGSLLPAANVTYSAPDPTVDPDGYRQWTAAQQELIWGAQNGLINSAPDLSKSPYFTNDNFQILLLYGDIDTIDVTTRNTGRIRTIEGVCVTNVSQMHDLSGEPFRERFDFIATDINGPNRTLIGS